MVGYDIQFFGTRFCGEGKYTARKTKEKCKSFELYDYVS